MFRTALLFSRFTVWRTLPFILLLAAVPLVAAPAFADADSRGNADSVVITKSENDNRSYRYLVLPNHLQVVLISDPSTERSAASLDVNVGSGEDPQQRPGLAHFLEHMLFLGTQKYPKSGEYQEFIQAHGGGHNAYTSLEHTNFHFDIDPAFLDPALDRFAQFFIAPTLDEDSVDKERNAVYSEFTAKYKEEGRRSWDVYAEITNPANKSAHFSVGTLDTLADHPESHVRNDLLRFYQTWYSANLMTLVVLGKEPLDELEAMVRPRFSQVRDRNVTLSNATVPLFPDHFLPATVNIRPVQQVRYLSVMFPVPPFEQWYREKPLVYLGDILGHEGRGSLFRVLHEKGWVESLSAGAEISNRQSAAFSVAMLLTEEGYRHTQEILDLLYVAIAQLRKDGVNQWRYTEQGAINNAAFRFQEKGDADDYVSTLANNLHYFRPQDVISGMVLMEHYDDALIRKYLDCFTPDNALVVISAPDVPVKKTSTYYKTQYATAPVADEDLQRWRSIASGKVVPADAGIHLPAPNEFVTKNFKIKHTEENKDGSVKGAGPRVLRDTVNLHLWFRQEDKYNVPRGDITISARSDRSIDGVQGSVLTAYFVRLLNDSFDLFAYPASLAGLNLGVDHRTRGIRLAISGYTEKQGLLLTRALDVMASPVFTETAFNHVKEELLRELQNEDKQPPYRQLRQDLAVTVSPHEYSRKDYEAFARTVDLKMVQEFAQGWLKSLNVDVLIYGNYTESDALKLSSIIGNKLGLMTTMHHSPDSLLVKLPASAHGFVHLVNADHQDVAVMHYVQGMDDSIAESARLRMLAQLTSSPFFDQLRTQQQLGYIVYGDFLSWDKVPGLVFVVQSPSHSAEQVDDSINRFLAQFAKTLATMPKEEFEQHRTALLRNLEEKPKNLGEEDADYWSQISLRYLDFDLRENMVAAVKAIDQKSLADYYWKLLLSPNVHRLVLVSLPKNQKLGNKLTSKYQVIDDVESFKRDREYFTLN